jgi:hypothetical protein
MYQLRLSCILHYYAFHDIGDFLAGIAAFFKVIEGLGPYRNLNGVLGIGMQVVHYFVIHPVPYFFKVVDVNYVFLNRL